MTKREKAKKLFEEGYNCSQAVFGAFSEDLGIDFETAVKISSTFGGGMGRLREVCGTVTGMFMVLGMKYGYTDPKANEEKKQLYKDVQSLADEFSQENGSIICRELLNLNIKGKDYPTPENRTQQYYQKRPCSQLCEYAADLVDNFIKEHKWKNPDFYKSGFLSFVRYFYNFNIFFFFYCVINYKFCAFGFTVPKGVHTIGIIYNQQVAF